MWIVKNSLRATLSLKGLGVTISPGAEFDLDAVGRDTAEHSPQVAVAFEEGYLKNVFKAAREAAVPGAPAAKAPDLSGLVTSADFEKFKTQFLDELRAQLPALQKLDKLDSLPTGANNVDLKTELASLRKGIADEMKTAADELKQIARDKIASEKRRILSDQSLSEADMKARLSFLDEQERTLVRNFETVGRKEEGDGGAVANADLLANL